MVFPSRRTGWYTAVCFELALVREGQEAYRLIQQINKIALRYMQSVIKSNLSDELLNQKLPQRYLARYKQAQAKEVEALKLKWEGIVREFIWRRSSRSSRPIAINV